MCFLSFTSTSHLPSFSALHLSLFWLFSSLFLVFCFSVFLLKSVFIISRLSFLFLTFFLSVFLPLLSLFFLSFVAFLYCLFHLFHCFSNFLTILIVVFVVLSFLFIIISNFYSSSIFPFQYFFASFRLTFSFTQLTLFMSLLQSFLSIVFFSVAVTLYISVVSSSLECLKLDVSPSTGACQARITGFSSLLSPSHDQAISPLTSFSPS